VVEELPVVPCGVATTVSVIISGKQSEK
jgi:hypothetical protein